MYSNHSSKITMPIDDLKTVNITVAGRMFPVKVTPEEEKIVRNLELELNDKIGDFQKTYPMRDKLDYVIMTMLTYTFDLKKSSIVEQSLEPLTKRINDLSALFDESE